MFPGRHCLLFQYLLGEKLDKEINNLEAGKDLIVMFTLQYSF